MADAHAPAEVPAGYVALDPPPAGTVAVVCRAPAVDAVRAVLERWGTLYAYAAAHPQRVELHGRGTAYAVPLGDPATDDATTGGATTADATTGDAAADGGGVVVRHGWRGGALRRVRRDLFRAPTRAPTELAASERLRAAGVPTPQVIVYAIYPAPLGLRRVDVATALVPRGADLAAVLEAPPALDADAQDAWVQPTAALLAILARAGVRHPDLNLKNVLLAPAPDARPAPHARAWALDVDVVRLSTGTPDDAPAAVLTTNLARLVRSLRKWGAAHAHDAATRGRLTRGIDALRAHAAAELRAMTDGGPTLPAGPVSAAPVPA